MADYMGMMTHPLTRLGAGMMAGFDPQRQGLGGFGLALAGTGRDLIEEQRYEQEQARARQLADLQLQTFQAELAAKQRATTQREQAAEIMADQSLTPEQRSLELQSIYPEYSAQLAIKSALEARKGIAVGNRLVDPYTGGVIYEPTGADMLEPKDREQIANTLRDDFSREATQFKQIQHNWEVMQGAANTPIGDVSRTYAFLKMVDPGAAVQEGDKANISNAGGVPAWVRSMYNDALGAGLDEGKRAMLEAEAGRIYNTALEDYNTNRTRFENLGAPLGIQPAAIAPQRQYKPYVPPPAGFVEDK